ncbi:alpha-mannosidase [Subtercola vilae]|uniref:Alpha-mannosidase n=1 Tax=Subtercola vilae TaxID=2056433 RepID=A0A4V4RGE7_9MICO|nr:glycoside hydrolase family 38 C-terminal domain-containing protein [Subtercola vilae]TIH36644.1 alpha-mannosidase [Subtercola vilae]
MHDDGKQIEMRLARFVRDRLQNALYRQTLDVTLTSHTLAGEPTGFEQATAGEFSPFALGQVWGAPWSTTWFRLSAEVPERWFESTSAGTTGIELVLDLGFNWHRAGYQAEGLLYSLEGRPLKGINPLNAHFDLTGMTSIDSRSVELFLEAAANPDFDIEEFRFRPTSLGDKATAGAVPQYTFRECSIALLDREVWELRADISVLSGLLEVLPRTLPRRASIERALEDMLNIVDPNDVSGTASLGRAALVGVLSATAYESAHAVVAIGHAHIDSAWLWPIRETIRKCARTFSNVLDLMDHDETFRFAASSAQQFAWMKTHYPTIFERITSKVRSGQFIPVGGMWVESDTNLPGGEALMRQFLHGKTFFREEFGIDSEEVWLPDSFGYSGALPQIARLAGAKWMLTQKMSWSHTNFLPHHTFFWEGIDGSQIFTHLPPVDTYVAELTAVELAHAEANFREKGRATVSLVPFGYGDGGGGPTREMVATAKRLASLEGSPTVEMAAPADFFRRAEAEYAHPPVWVGEMYLESHRGTYTSQAPTKQGNRRSEHLLREAELWASTSSVRTGAPYPYDELDEVWKTVLLLQFHDILPGSSIAWVHREAETSYEAIAQRLEAVIARSLRELSGVGSIDLLANALPDASAGVGSLAIGRPVFDSSSLPVRVTRINGSIELDNGLVRLRIDPHGLLVSLIDLSSGREAIPAGERANLLQLHADIPNEWDAWDIDRHYLSASTDITDVVGIDVDDDASGNRVCISVARRFGSSQAVQRISIERGSTLVGITIEVDWHERQKLLKLAFPLAVKADTAASEIQFGHVYRPTHSNTSWQYAQFETPAHRWVHVGEPGFGVAVANDSTYGYDIRRHTRADRTPVMVVRASLLRAPLYPDPESDQGHHRFGFSLRAAATIGDAIADGYSLNVPPRAFKGERQTAPIVRVSDVGVVVESVKLAEDRSGDVIVRLYEARGDQRPVTVRVEAAVISIRCVDGLERDDLTIHPAPVLGEASIHLVLRPFQIVTLRVVLASTHEVERNGLPTDL